MSKAISITGDRQLDRALKRLPKVLSKKVIRGALRESAKPLVKQARSNISTNGLRKTGNLWRSIGTISDRSKKFKGSIRVGARMRKGGSRNTKGFHAHFFEFGTAPRRAKKGRLAFQGKNGRLKTPKQVKGITARPFLRPAYSMTHKRVTGEFGQIAGTRLLREMKRVIKKNGR